MKREVIHLLEENDTLRYVNETFLGEKLFVFVTSKNA